MPYKVPAQNGGRKRTSRVSGGGLDPVGVAALVAFVGIFLVIFVFMILG